MPASLLFWILYIISVIFGFWVSWPLTRGFGPILMLFVLVGILGWKLFGAAVR